MSPTCDLRFAPPFVDATRDDRALAVCARPVIELIHGVGMTVTFPNAFTAEECESILKVSLLSDHDYSAPGWTQLRVSELTAAANDEVWRIGELQLYGGFGVHEYSAASSADHHEDSAGVDWHFDAPEESLRHGNFLLASLQLAPASAYTGGGLGVGPLVATREQGSLIIFPGILPHAVRNVSRGARWSLVSYYAGSWPGTLDQKQQHATRMLLAAAGRMAGREWEADGRKGGLTYDVPPVPAMVLVLCAEQLLALQRPGEARLLFRRAEAACPRDDRGRSGGGGRRGRAAPPMEPPRGGEHRDCSAVRRALLALDWNAIR